MDKRSHRETKSWTMYVRIENFGANISLFTQISYENETNLPKIACEIYKVLTKGKFYYNTIRVHSVCFF